MNINGFVTQVRDGDSVILDAQFSDAGEMLIPARYLYSVTVHRLSRGMVHFTEKGSAEMVGATPARSCLIIRH